MIPTSRLAAVTAVVALGLLVAPVRSWWVLAALIGALALLFVLDGLAAPPASSIGVERLLPNGVTAGATAEVGWRLWNPHGRAVRVAVVDELWPSFHAGSRRVDTTLPPGSTVRATTTIRPSRRGRFPVEDVTVRVVGPLRLTARQRTRSLPGVLRVLPAFASRDEARRRLQRARIVELGVRIARGRGSGSEFEQLREFGPDDEYRRLDWAATARRGVPIVRDYRVERNQTVIAMLDNGRVMAGTVDGVPRVEHAMDAVLALTTVAGAIGDRTGLVSFDRQVRTVVAPGSGNGQLSRLTEAMYQLEPELADSDYGAAFTYTAHRFRRRSLLVVLTELSEASLSEGVLPALPVLSRRHLVVVAAVQDPHVAAWAIGGDGGDDSPTIRSAAFREAAAVSALERRRISVGMLRAAGAVVVDAPPGRLAMTLVDTYLELKASGRL